LQPGKIFSPFIYFWQGILCNELLDIHVRHLPKLFGRYNSCKLFWNKSFKKNLAKSKLIDKGFYLLGRTSIVNNIIVVGTYLNVGGGSTIGPQNQTDWPCELNWQVVVHDNVVNMSKIIIHLQFCPLGHPLSRGKPPPTRVFYFYFVVSKRWWNFLIFWKFFSNWSKIIKPQKKDKWRSKSFLKLKLCHSPNENSHLVNL
jgi:hypothetical protein